MINNYLAYLRSIKLARCHIIDNYICDQLSIFNWQIHLLLLLQIVLHIKCVAITGIYQRFMNLLNVKYVYIQINYLVNFLF